MKINNLYYGILLYGIIVILLVFIKPNLIYDYKKSEYKKYGSTEDKTLFTLPVIAIALAIIIAVTIVMSDEANKNNADNKINTIVNLPSNLVESTELGLNQNVVYVPVYYQKMFHCSTC